MILQLAAQLNPKLKLDTALADRNYPADTTSNFELAALWCEKLSTFSVQGGWIVNV